MAKVMLVEDDNSLRQIYADRLAAEGYQIITAKDGEEALAIAIKERPDLIIADIMMPKVSGFDMLDILRSTTETRDTKIIMMTALSQAEDKVRAEKLGADKYLVKSQVTLEDVAHEAAAMLEEQQKSADKTVKSNTGNQPTAPAAFKRPEQPAVSTPAPQKPTAEQKPTSIPVASPPADAAKADSTISMPPQPGSQMPPAAMPATKPVSQESTSETQAMNQIDEFIASNPTLSTSPDGATNSASTSSAGAPAQPPAPTTSPAADQSAAQPRKQITVTDDSDDASATSTPAAPANSEPEATADAATQKAIDGLLGDTNPTPAPEPQLETKPEKNKMLPKEEATQEADSEDSEGMKHTKRIEPDADLTSSAPNINELLAQETASGATPPPVGSEIVPGGGSVSQLKDSNQNPIPQQRNFEDEPDNSVAAPPSDPNTVSN